MFLREIILKVCPKIDYVICICIYSAVLFSPKSSAINPRLVTLLTRHYLSVQKKQKLIPSSSSCSLSVVHSQTLCYPHLLSRTFRTSLRHSSDPSSVTCTQSNQLAVSSICCLIQSINLLLFSLNQCIEIVHLLARGTQQLTVCCCHLLLGKIHY